MKNNKAITLVSLIITVVVLLILTGVTLYTNNLSTKNAEKQKFIENINQIETAINTRWLRYQNDNSIGLPGTKLESVPEQLTSIITLINDESKENWYYYINNDAINSLDLENIQENKYIIRYSTGEVISVDGIEIEGEFYYTKNFNK